MRNEGRGDNEYWRGSYIVSAAVPAVDAKGEPIGITCSASLPQSCSIEIVIHLPVTCVRFAAAMLVLSLAGRLAAMLVTSLLLMATGLDR